MKKFKKSKIAKKVLYISFISYILSFFIDIIQKSVYAGIDDLMCYPDIVLEYSDHIINHILVPVCLIYQIIYLMVYLIVKLVKKVKKEEKEREEFENLIKTEDAETIEYISKKLDSKNVYSEENKQKVESLDNKEETKNIDK
jgi:large-conductance mechanosensitive channel